MAISIFSPSGDRCILIRVVALVTSVLQAEALRGTMTV